MALRPTSLSAIVIRYYLYMATASLGFLAPVWVVLLEARGLSFTEIALLDAVFFGTITLAEIPTGYVGDRVGRRNALVASSFVVAASAVGFGFARGLAEFLVVYVLWGVAVTFRSGNDSAWLYDTLARFDQEGAFTTVRGRGQAVFFGVTAVAALGGGLLATRDLAYPFVATGALNAASGLVLLTLPETRAGEGDRLSIPAAARAVRRLARPPLRRFVASVALLLAVGWSVDLYVQPISTRAGLSLVGLGGLYAAMTAASAVAANYAGAVRDRFGARRPLDALAPALGIGYLLFLAAPAVAVPVFLLARAGLNLATPLAEGYLNDRTPSLGRATALSGFSMAVSVVTIPLKLASGAVADATTLFVAVAALGAVLLCGSLLARAIPTAGPPGHS